MNIKKFLPFVFMFTLILTTTLLQPATKANASIPFWSLKLNGVLVEKDTLPVVNGKMYMSLNTATNMLADSNLTVVNGHYNLKVGTTFYLFKMKTNRAEIRIPNKNMKVEHMSKNAFVLGGKLYIPMDYALAKFNLSMKGIEKPMTVNISGEALAKGKYKKVYSQRFNKDANTIRQYQMAIMSLVAYANVENFVGKSVRDLSPYILQSDRKDLKEFQTRGRTVVKASYYKGLTPVEIFDGYRMGEWKILTTSKNEKLGWSGMYGVMFQNTKTKEIVISFRGTEFDSDKTRDLVVTDALGVGLRKVDLVSQGQMTEATQFFKSAKKYGKTNYSFTGHSLGGYLAQYVGVRASEPFGLIVLGLKDNVTYKETITFNAPGYGVSGYDDLKYGKSHYIDGDLVGKIYYKFGKKITYKIGGSSDWQAKHAMTNFLTIDLRTKP